VRYRATLYPGVFKGTGEITKEQQSARIFSTSLIPIPIPLVQYSYSIGVRLIVMLRYILSCGALIFQFSPLYGQYCSEHVMLS
jgi:hypothetical protein